MRPKLSREIAAALMPQNRTIVSRISDELREFAIVSLYLYVCFTALAYLKFAILQAHGIPFAPFGLAAAKALICAKFVLVGRMLRVGERYRTRPLIWPTLHKSVAFLILLLALNAGEEVILGLVHHQSVIESLKRLGGGTVEQLVATSVIVFLVLVPFFAFRALGEQLGQRNLLRLFFVSSKPEVGKTS